jgi:hypothetical protein
VADVPKTDDVSRLGLGAQISVLFAIGGLLVSVLLVLAVFAVVQTSKLLWSHHKCLCKCLPKLQLLLLLLQKYMELALRELILHSLFLTQQVADALIQGKVNFQYHQ